MLSEQGLSSLNSRCDEIAAILFERLASRKSDDILSKELKALARKDTALALDEEVVATLAPPNARALLRDICTIYVDRFHMRFQPLTYACTSRILPAFLGAAFARRWNALRPLRSFDQTVSCHGASRELEALHSAGTVVFACAHSSNLDSLAIGLVLKRAGFPPCVYPAGKHLYRNRLAAHMVSRLGAYQLDRGLDAILYKEIVIEYSTLLIEEGFHSVIFPAAPEHATAQLTAT